jgi:hypothetical protein
MCDNHRIAASHRSPADLADAKQMTTLFSLFVMVLDVHIQRETPENQSSSRCFGALLFDAQS